MNDLSMSERINLGAAESGYRRAMAPLAGIEWRTGRSISTIWARTGGDDWKRDVWIGEFRTPELAQRTVEDHRTAREWVPGLEELLDEGFKVALYRKGGRLWVELDNGEDTAGGGTIGEAVAEAVTLVKRGRW